MHLFRTDNHLNRIGRVLTAWYSAGREKHADPIGDIDIGTSLIMTRARAMLAPTFMVKYHTLLIYSIQWPTIRGELIGALFDCRHCSISILH